MISASKIKKKIEPIPWWNLVYSVINNAIEVQIQASASSESSFLQPSRFINALRSDLNNKFSFHISVETKDIDTAKIRLEEFNSEQIVQIIKALDEIKTQKGGQKKTLKDFNYSSDSEKVDDSQKEIKQKSESYGYAHWKLR